VSANISLRPLYASLSLVQALSARSTVNKVAGYGLDSRQRQQLWAWVQKNFLSSRCLGSFHVG